MNKELKEIWYHIPRHRQRQFWLLLILMVISSLLEIISIGAVLPFLGVLTAPEYIFQNQYIQPLIKLLELTEPDQLLFPITILFIISALIAGLVRISMLYAVNRFAFMTGSDMSIDIYQRTLHQKYTIHISRNTSEIISGITSKTGMVIQGIISPALNFMSSIVLTIGIMSILFLVNIVVAMSIFVSFAILYLLIAIYTKKRLKSNGQIIADQSTQMIKSLQEGLGGIRDVIIDGSQQFYCNIYRNSEVPLRRAAANNIFINQSPRHIMDIIGITLIASVAYMMTRGDGDINIIVPILGAFALGAQRLLPALQQIYSSFSTIRGSEASLKDVLILLNQKIPEYINKHVSSEFSFEKEILLENVRFRHTKNSPWILKNINLLFYKGTKIGFVGETGSGKSTLIDIVMGLLSPTEGNLVIDGYKVNDQNIRQWQSRIAHVPQNIFLSDNTIEENIAFGIPKEEVDLGRVKVAAEQAQISELIDGWKDGYQTHIGERGTRLSGGQKQRIGIARALYKKADVLILDEATSALDNTTEHLVMEAIESLNRNVTVFIIAHRLTTLRSCDRIITIDGNHNIIDQSYKKMIEKQGSKLSEQQKKHECK